MAFPQDVVFGALYRAGARCECKRTTCGHMGRCNEFLVAQAWHAHHRLSQAAGGSDGLENCEILCMPCCNNSQSYDRS